MALFPTPGLTLNHVHGVARLQFLLGSIWLGSAKGLNNRDVRSHLIACNLSLDGQLAAVDVTMLRCWLTYLESDLLFWIGVTGLPVLEVDFVLAASFGPVACAISTIHGTARTFGNNMEELTIYKPSISSFPLGVNLGIVHGKKQRNFSQGIDQSLREPLQRFATILGTALDVDVGPSCDQDP